MALKNLSALGRVWALALVVAVAVGVLAAAGSAGAAALNAPVVGITGTPDGQGYWLAASDGGVFSFGDAGFYGSAANVKLAKPVVGIAATHDGKGYWLTAQDGGVFSYGDAGYYGSMAGKTLAKPVVGIAATPDGKGYWLVGADGGVFAFGDAGYYGGMAGKTLAKPVVGIAAAPDGKGYWLTGGDGGVFSFGDAAYYGGMAGKTLTRPVVGIAATPDGKGYWLTGGDGGVFSFGDAVFKSSVPGGGVGPAPAPAPPAPKPPAPAPAPPAPSAPAQPAPPPTPGGASLGTVRQAVVDAAFSQNGYDPRADGCARYSESMCSYPVDEEWCSVFATWTWEQAGVPIPIYPFSGDPYIWAQSHTYVLSPSQPPAPGDLVFFGTGPGSASSSIHVAVVTQVFPSGEIATMNGNDGNDQVGPSSFMPPDEPGLGPIYGYASPVAGDAPADARTITFTDAQLASALKQDPPSYKRAFRRQARKHPAFEHMPYVGRQITIEIFNVHPKGKKQIVVWVLYHGKRRAAKRDFRAFLHRYHDRGNEYVVRYKHEHKHKHSKHKQHAHKGHAKHKRHSKRKAHS